MVIKMLCVEIYDEEHEDDLKFKINNFLKGINEGDIIDIKYNIHAFLGCNGQQIYCYSALIIYRLYK